MGKLLGIVSGVLFLLYVIGSCGPEPEGGYYDIEAENAKIRAEFDSHRLPATSEGEQFRIGVEPGAEYRLLKWSRMSNGNVETMVRRDGKSGTSFARREVDCETRPQRYLGEGDTQEDALKDSPNPGVMSGLVDGSSASDLVNFVCSKV